MEKRGGLNVPAIQSVKVSRCTLVRNARRAAERLDKPLPFSARQKRELAEELLRVFDR